MSCRAQASAARHQAMWLFMNEVPLCVFQH
jgi:hypothetical protein